MVIRGKARVVSAATSSPDPWRAGRPRHSRGSPTLATVVPSRRDFLLTPLEPNHYCFPPHHVFGQHDAARAIQPVFLPTACAPRQSTSAPLVASWYPHWNPVSGPLRSGTLLAHASAACVRACMPPRASAPVCARVRVTIIRREQLYEEPTASDPFTLC